MCYISMDLSWQGLQANGKIFLKFWINGRKLKNIQTDSELRILIKFHSVIGISRDSSQHALQTNGKLSSIFGVIFRISLTTNFWNNGGVGFIQETWRCFVLISTHSTYFWYCMILTKQVYHKILWFWKNFDNKSLGKLIQNSGRLI